MIGKNNNTDGEFGAHNQIAKGTQIQGDIKTEGVLRVDGTLKGSIESTGKVVIGPSGSVDGSVICASANIAGYVKAKVQVKELMHLQASAKLHGDITVGKLAIEPGATFSGTCSMGGVVKELTREERKEVSEKTA